MRTAQEKFDAACEHYNKAMQNIETITSIYEKVTKEKHPYLKKQFDVFLQMGLLRLSIGDGHFSHLERVFIEQIVDNGDILEFVNQKYNTELTWEGIEASTAEQISEFLSLDKVLDAIADLMHEFFLPVFAVYEGASSELWDNTVEEVTSICEIFTVLDDDCDTIAKTNAIQHWIHIFFVQYIEMFRERLKQYNTDKHSLTGNFGKLNGNTK